MKGSKVGKVVAMVFVGISIAVTLGMVLGLGLGNTFCSHGPLSSAGSVTLPPEIPFDLF